ADSVVLWGGNPAILDASTHLDARSVSFAYGDVIVAGTYRADSTEAVNNGPVTHVTFTATSTVENLGALTLNHAVVDLTAATLAPGVTSLPSLHLGGTLRRADNWTVTGPFTAAGGTLDAAGGAGSLTANGGADLAGSLTLDGYTLNNPAVATWTAGNI